MILEKAQCLYVLTFLYGGIILTLFIRAFVRRRLLKYYADVKEKNPAAGITNRLVKLFLVVPRQIQALKQLGESIEEAPVSVQRRYKYFQILTLTAIVMLVLLVISSFVAHQICGS